jgi:hypothetical protein
MSLSDYPTDWRAISQSIRFGRAKGACETCGAKHGWYVARDKDGRNVDQWDKHEQAAGAFYDGLHVVRIVLTTAHTCDCVPKCGNESHLKAECQRCHLLRDVEQHKRTRAANRRRRQAEAGQGFLISDIDE